jgi:hypothetical protein
MKRLCTWTLITVVSGGVVAAQESKLQRGRHLTSTNALWQRWGDEGVVKFLETAKNPRGGKTGSNSSLNHLQGYV